MLGKKVFSISVTTSLEDTMERNRFPRASGVGLEFCTGTGGGGLPPSAGDNPQPVGRYGVADGTHLVVEGLPCRAARWLLGAVGSSFPSVCGLRGRGEKGRF